MKKLVEFSDLNQAGRAAVFHAELQVRKALVDWGFVPESEKLDGGGIFLNRTQADNALRAALVAYLLECNKPVNQGAGLPL